MRVTDVLQEPPLASSFQTVWAVAFVAVFALVTVANVMGVLRTRRRLREHSAPTGAREVRGSPRPLGHTNGGAVLPDLGRFSGPGGTFTLSADEAGVHINLHAAWNQKLMLASLRTRWRRFDGDDLWYADWSGIRLARRDRDGDAIFMVNATGARVWFCGSYPADMASFTRELRQHGVAVVFVKSSCRDLYRSRRHWCIPR